MALVIPSSVHDMQTIKNILKIENIKQKMNVPLKSGN